MANQAALAQAVLGLLAATPAPPRDVASTPRSRSPRRRSRERSRRSPSLQDPHPEMDSFCLEKLEAVALHHKQHRTMQMCRPDQVRGNHGSRKAMAIGSE